MEPRNCVAARTCLILSAAKTLNQTEFPLTNGGCISLSTAIDEVLKAKRGANLRERYCRSLERYLRQFAKGQEARELSSFTHVELEAWLAKYPCAVTRQTWKNRLSALFSFTVRRGHIPSNPVDRLERVRVDRKPPVILTPGQSQILLRACPTLCKPYLVLGMFAGIRPEEIMRLDWSHLDLVAKTALVDGKTRRHRLVPLPAVAVTELVKHPLQRGPVSPCRAMLTRWKARARRAIGFERWPQDLLRHTAASYLLARHQDAAKVALWLGNSPKILLSTYIVPVCDAALAEFWGSEPAKGATARADVRSQSPGVTSQAVAAVIAGNGVASCKTAETTR